MQKPQLSLTIPILLTLSLVGIMGPLGTDLYLPAFPQLAHELSVSASTVQLTLTAFTIGMAFGQLVVGSLSDRYGRKLPMLVGAIMVAISSVGAALAADATQLIVACGFIGLSASAGMAVGRAVVSDLSTGQQAARSFSLLGLIVGFGPIVGPIAGAATIAIFGGWRAIFWCFAAFAIFVFLVLLFLPESLPRANRHSGGFTATLSAAGKVLSNRTFIFFASTIWFGFAAMFAYISASSFIVQSVLKMTALEYTYVFGGIGIGLMVTGYIATRLLNRIKASTLILVGVGQLAIGSILLLALAASLNLSAMGVILSLLLIGSAMGFVFGPAASLAVSQVRSSAGTAMALLGSLQFVFAGLAAPLVGIAGKTAVWPFASVSLVCAVLALVAAGLGRMQEQKTI